MRKFFLCYLVLNFGCLFHSAGLSFGEQRHAANQSQEILVPAKRPSVNEARFSEIIQKNAESARFCSDAKEGEICLMNWKDAISFCQSRNSHLPTAREYIQVAKPLGTRILETSEVKGKPPAGYYLVNCENLDGTKDAFYANNSDYRRPKAQVGNHLLWTASTPPGHPQFAHVYYDELGGGGGKPEEHLKTRRNAVQCVPNP